MPEVDLHQREALCEVFVQLTKNLPTFVFARIGEVIVGYSTENTREQCQYVSARIKSVAETYGTRIAPPNDS